MKSIWNLFPDYQNNQWDALSIFVSNYAFERGGTNNPDYPALSVDILQQSKDGGRRLDGILATAIWDEWKNSITRLEKKKDIDNWNDRSITFNVNRKSERYTKKSIIEFVEGMNATLPYYLKNLIEKEGVRKAYNEFSEVVGVGGKIASFYLRDVTQILEPINFLEKESDRFLLQPQDIWVNRISNKLFFDVEYYKSDSDKPTVRTNGVIRSVAKTIIQECGNRYNPEVVNMGMWYFSARVMKARYRLMKMFESEDPLEFAIEYCRKTNWGVWKKD